MMNDSADRETSTDPRKQELLWPHRQHPNRLIVPEAFPTRWPGTWVAIYDSIVTGDQMYALWVEGFNIERITLLEGGRAQVVIKEEARPDRRDTADELTNERYAQYDPRAPRSLP